MKNALIASTVYFLGLFALGFALGTVRVMLIVPRFGQFTATVAEAPFMLVAAFFICRWAVRHWRVPRTTEIRAAMVLWFLALLFIFETLMGAALFGLTLDAQWARLATLAGLLGLSTQIVAALLPMVVGRR